MTRARNHRIQSAGFTLIELVMVILLVSILAVYAAVSLPTSGSVTVSDQADLLARDLRHAQTLAMTWGRSLRFSVDSTTVYAVRCVTAGTAPCASTVTPVTDPARNGNFSVTLSNGATVAGPTIDFDTKGKPSAGGTYTLTAAGVSHVVTLTALTGFVSVSP